MVTAEGLPIGTAFTSMGTDKNGHDVAEYLFKSAYIRKERARNGAKSLRSSTCLKRLVKTLKDDLSKVSPTPRYVRLMRDRIAEQVARGCKLDTRNNTYITNDNAEAVLFNLFENKPIEPEIKDRLAKMYEKHREVQTNIKTLNNEISAFNKCYVMYGTSKSPVMFGVAEKVNDHFVFQDGVKCYEKLEDLPQDFVLAYKMWKVGTNLSESTNCIQADHDDGVGYHTPLHLELIKEDSYNEAFAVFSSYDHHDSPFGTEYTIVIPIPNAN
jgi:hypothetical protein